MAITGISMDEFNLLKPIIPLHQHIRLLGDEVIKTYKHVDINVEAFKKLESKSHPKLTVPRVLDTDDNKHFFIAEPYLEGYKTGHDMTFKNYGQIIEIWANVLKTMKEMHAIGIYHLDLHRSNVMFDDNLDHRIIDFNMARVDGIKACDEDFWNESYEKTCPKIGMNPYKTIDEKSLFRLFVTSFLRTRRITGSKMPKALLSLINEIYIKISTPENEYVKEMKEEKRKH